MEDGSYSILMLPIYMWNILYKKKSVKRKFSALALFAVMRLPQDDIKLCQKM